MNKRAVIFDALLLAYLTAAAYFCLYPTSQENAAAHMTTILQGLAITLAGTSIITYFAHKLKLPTLGGTLFGTTLQRTGAIPWLQALAAFVLTMIVSFKMTEFSFSELTDPEGLKGAWRLYLGLTHVNWSILPTALVQIVETIFLAFLSTILALPIAFALAFLSAKNIMTNPASVAVYLILRALSNIVRSVEPLIWALIFTVWVGIGPFAGMLALMIHSCASLTKQFSEIIEDVQVGPLEGIRATGANIFQVLRFGVLPQVVLPFISFTIYRWDTNVRMATIIGLVGGGGIGTMLIKYQGQAMWPEVGCIIFVIAVAVWIMDTASAYIREALR